MKKILAASLLVSLAALAPSAQAQDAKLKDIEIKGAWARATAAGMPNGAAYMHLQNKGKATDNLLEAKSDIAKSVELHMHLMEGNIARMRPLGSIEVPAGKMVMLEPGGLHVMLMGLKAPLKEGDKIPLTLVFRDSGEVKVSVPVKPATHMGNMPHDMGKHDMGKHDMGNMPHDMGKGGHMMEHGKGKH